MTTCRVCRKRKVPRELITMCKKCALDTAEDIIAACQHDEFIDLGSNIGRVCRNCGIDE